jgi:hypothetical protein
MLLRAVTSALVLVLASWVPPSNAQTKNQEREMDGVMTDTCCWCGPRPPTCQSKDEEKDSKAQHNHNCVNKCVLKKHAHYVIAPQAPCPQSATARPGYVLDDKYNELAARYAGKSVHVRGIFDDDKHEVQVATIGPADSPLQQNKEHNLVAHERIRGWITDSKCGARGANAGAEACTKKCLAAGAKMVVVTDSDQKVLNVENPDALKGHEGHHVAVTGHVTGDSIHVESAKML